MIREIKSSLVKLTLSQVNLHHWYLILNNKPSMFHMRTNGVSVLKFPGDQNICIDKS